MLVLGVVGIFVPLLPTTPFLLLAAALWVRSSPRLYEWLLAHRCFGGYIRNFRENRAIPLRAKVVSIALMWGTMLYCIFGLLDGRWWAQVGLLAVAVGGGFLSVKPYRVRRVTDVGDGFHDFLAEEVFANALTGRMRLLREKFGHKGRG